MKKRLLSLWLALCLCLGLLPAAALAAGTQSVSVELTMDHSAAYEQLEQLNQLRREAGVGELVMDEAMMEMAEQRAVECAVFYSHTRPNGEKFDTARPAGTKGSYGENILYGSWELDARDATQSWYDSSGHRENMLGSVYNCVGIACVRDRTGQTYWVQEFFSGKGTPETARSSGTAHLRFTVEADPAYLTVQLDPSALRLEAGEKQVVYTCTDRGTPIVPTILRTSDEGVARLSVEDGGVCVEAVGEGAATLTLGYGGKSTDMTVTVMRAYADLPAELMILQPSGELRVRVGESISVSATFRPWDTEEYTMQWGASKGGPIAVEASGPKGAVITGLRPGTGTVTVQSEPLPNGQALWSSAEVTVYDDSQEAEEPEASEEPETPEVPEETEEPEEPQEPELPQEPQEPEETERPAGTGAEDLDLSAYHVHVIPGEQVRLRAYVRPEGTAQDVTWESEDPSVATVDQDGLVTGRADGETTVVARTPDRAVSSLCLVEVTASSQGTPISFTDVKAGDYCYDAAAWATAQYLLMVPSGGPLGVGRDCTRLEIVRYLWKLMGSPLPEDRDSQTFTDLSRSVGGDDRLAIQWAVETGVTTGTSGTTFSPDMAVTRAQAVTFLHRAQGLPRASGGTGFTDVAAGDWFADAAVWAVQEGITTGTTSSTFTPDRACSRGEILTFLFRTYG